MARIHSDDRLVRRAQHGDRPALEAIFARYQQDLYRFCLSQVGNAHDAEDALQNTMVKVIRSLPGETRSIHLKPWIYRIARNESIDTIRRRRELAATDPEELATGTDLTDTVAVRQRLGRLIEDLSELPERQRAALVMRELGDLEFVEIGSALDASPATARQAVYEARLSLRQMETGREMRCDEVIWEISESDGRTSRRREIQAHLRDCEECRAFQRSIVRRRGELRAIAPLPLAASAALLQGALAAGSGGAGAAGTALLGSTIAKTAATCAVVAAIGTAAANRSGFIDLPVGGNRVEAGERDRSSAAPMPNSGQRIRRAREDSSRAGAGVIGPRRSARREAPALVAGGGADDPAGSAEGPPPDTAPEAAPLDTGEGVSATPGKRGKGSGQGKAAGLPPSSSHGQETAASHRSPNGNSSPGTPRARGRSEAARDNASTPREKPQQEAAAAPVSEPAAQGKGGGAEHGGGKQAKEGEAAE